MKSITISGEADCFDENVVKEVLQFIKNLSKAKDECVYKLSFEGFYE